MSAAETALDQALSAVMDGRATPEEWAQVNAAWAGDPGLRERWALWHAAGDGLRSAELPALHREPQRLLDALHARMPAPVVEHPRRRDWFAPLAVAAGFVAMAVGVGALRPAPAPQAVVAAAPAATSRVQGLAGMSFAQTAAGRTLPALGTAREAGLPVDAPPEIIDWGLALPEPAASHALP
ncbi:negative regulator of sigma E activity [Pelomonas aquatica]|uniref:Negative regulator of sigma E activity n=1 Tax=Pelomonas aquatica TaxID=431058 RepID=A0ABU1Z598_9BURK|nr:RseA family anti-sigma factor [Pelomonas aquatica]MDR7295788.1 negative regulator of sigma E activity [Pelomonas aquatica]